MFDFNKDLMPKSVEDPAKNAVVMEDHIFSNTKSGEEYLNLLDKLYLHFMNMPRKILQEIFLERRK